MGSPTITKTMREKICADVIATQFKKETDAFKKKEIDLADRAYKERYTKEYLKAMKLLGDDFLCQRHYVTTNIRGMTIRLNFSGFANYYDESQRKYIEGENRFGERSDNAFVPSQQLADAIYDFTNEDQEFRKRKGAAAMQLMAILESVRTFKKLRSVWPEGEEFYEVYDVDNEKPGVPAVVVTELNKVLGIK